MTSATTFLRLIAEDPHDRTSSLVFADWLEERDNSLDWTRGELMRIQTALAHWVPDVDRREHLQDREQQLLRTHQEAWLGPLLAYCRDWRFVQGLPHVTMPAERFLSTSFAEEADDCFRRAWVQRLRLEHISTVSVQDLGRAAYLYAIPCLDLAHNALDDKAIAAVTDSPHLAGLVSLDLSNNEITDIGFRTLLMSRNLAGLTRLDLRNNQIHQGASPELIRQQLPGLRELKLAGNDLAPDSRLWQPEKDSSRCLTNNVGMELILIPAGSFRMGSPADEEVEERPPNGVPGADERPRHRVTLTQPFFMSATPVTQRQYEAVMGRNPAEFSIDNRGSPFHPVEQVTWDDADRFCRRLSELPAESAAGRAYRLPTEAEWEYACRAGSRWAFSWGNAACSLQANFDGARPYGTAVIGPDHHRTIQVGSYPPNAFGLYDMHGNVWEWCQDWYDQQYYGDSPELDPQGPRNGNRKTVRGGSWGQSGSLCRSACRDFWYGTSHARNNIGFRVVMTGPTE